MSLRMGIEAATRSWILRRHLPENFGRTPIYVSPSSGLRYLFRRMAKVDPCLLAMAKTYVKPGMVVWDIGANVGLFSFASAWLAGSTGHVVAVEPDL